MNIFHDNNALPELVEKITKSYNVAAIGKLFDYVTYEGNEIFRCLAENGCTSYSR